MQNKRINLLVNLVILLSFLSVSSAASAGHFISDPAYRQGVEVQFRQKMKLVGQKFYDLNGLDASEEEQEALRFLYAYMPTADITDYPTAFHLAKIRAAFRARSEMPWGGEVPELLFRHFVLPVRVNNEPLDSSRTVFYRELRQRLKGMTMKEAILEVNHWCHEHVTYEPSDARTSSPLQTMRTAKGRCGEESTFTVAALRAVGIPARQVYTPRWAHTDDNHAWVEAWADGRWWFLGACEPEPVLNLAWFNEPASRAMLTHTKVFGNYTGPEEVVLRTPTYTEINLIGNYADTARCDFLVVDTSGNPVPNARVEFKIYNYAEYYTAVTKYTDKDGRTSLTAGLGDMLVWASDGNGKTTDAHYGYAKASFGKDKLVKIVLSKDGGSVVEGEDVDIVPPKGRPIIPTVTDAQRSENEHRKAYEDSVRNSYVATFPTEESCRLISTSPDANVYRIKSRGNWRVIEEFLNKYQYQHGRAMALLSTLSDKDLRDMPLEILSDNMDAKSSQLCPRVEDEMISRPFKIYLENAFGSLKAKFQKNPDLLVGWIRDSLRINHDISMNIAQTPVGVYESRITDERSRDIFFVDVARSLDIAARKDVVTGKVQYQKEGKWIDVNFDNVVQSAVPKGILKLDYESAGDIDNPKYYSHFTLSKISEGRAQLLNYDEAGDGSDGTTWANTFRDGTELDAGTYLLVSGRRMADGSVLARNAIFRIEPGKPTEIPLVIRDSEEGVKVIGSFPSESVFTRISGTGKSYREDGEKSILSQTGRGYYVLGIIATGQEPTNHALRDISKAREAMEKWGRPFVLLFENADDARKFNAADYGTLPSNITFGIDNGGKILKSVRNGVLSGKAATLPVFIIADTFDRVVFSSQGYTIGLGEQLEKVANKL